jgi:MFS family permease
MNRRYVERVRRGPWGGVLAVAIGHLSVDACAGVWPVYKVLAGLDLRAAGWIAGWTTLCGNGLQLAFGALADRGQRRLLVALGVVAAGAICFLPYARSEAALLALMLVGAAGSAAYHPAGAGHASAAPTGRPGLAFALYLAGGYVGFAGSQLAYAGAFRALDGRLAPLFALPLLLGGAFLWVRSPGSARAPAAPAPARGAAAMPWLKLALLFAVQALSATVGASVQFLTPEIFGGGGTTLAMGGAHCLATLAGAAALFPAGWARDRFGARAVLVAANALAGVALGLLAALGARGPAVALGLVLAFTLANAVNTVVALAEGTVGLARAGSTVSALLMGVPWLLASPGPALAAHLAHAGGPARALSWMALCSPAAAAVALLLPRPSRSPPTTAAPPAPT